MTVDQYTSEHDFNDCIEIRKDQEVVFKGTIRGLQNHFYDLAQCEIKKNYQLTEHSHYLTI